MTAGERPDRPIASALRPLRSTIRSWRLLRHRLRLGRRLSTGRNIAIGGSARLLPPQFIRLGDNVAIGAEFHVEANLDVGSDVLISSRVAVVGRDHDFRDRERTIFWAGRLQPGTVTIEGDNLIGFGTIIVAPARIGRGCIVGAGAVVVGDLPPETVCVGVPARPIGPRVRSGD